MPDENLQLEYYLLTDTRVTWYFIFQFFTLSIENIIEEITKCNDISRVLVKRVTKKRVNKNTIHNSVILKE